MNSTTTLAQWLSSTLGIDLGQMVFGNTLFLYVVAATIFVVLIVAFKVLQTVIISRLKALSKKTHTDIDDMLVRVISSVRPPVYFFIALYIALRALELNEWVAKSLTALLLISITYQVIKTVGIFIDYIGEKKMMREEAEEGKVDPGTEAAIGLIKTIAKALLWIIGFLMVLSNLGIEITSLIAGLGIGGIAIAFALQAILGDLFSSFSIYFDKPFKPGDFIIVDDMMGTVERVGIKTTRIRALQGQEIVMANADLTSSRINNYKRMEKRRIVFQFRVTYETPTAKLEKIPELVRGIFSRVENAELDRVHFATFGDFSLNFEVVYFVKSGDYNEYMDIQQNANLELLRTFEREGIVFAHPIQTVYLKKNDG